MSTDAIFGFAGVLVGSLVTAIITLYRDTLAARRDLLDEMRTAAGDSIWADTLEQAETHGQRLEPLLRDANARVTAILPQLY
jgi:hypothetical protein